MSIIVPHGFTPRDYQKALYNAPAQGFKRGVAIWHRRAGKDKVFVAMMAKAAMQRKGAYFYILPYYKQARKIIWEGVDSSGQRYLDVIPQELIKKQNNQEMVLELVNGSITYMLGSDNIDSIVGTNPIGIFFSEFSLHKPQVWDYLRPILLENGGFAFFNGTPRGRNHLYSMFQAAQADPTWFSQCLDITDTNVMSEQDVESEIENGMARATAKQEFYCSFDAALQGAYYEEPLNRAAANGQHSVFPIDPYIPVDVAWDLGMRDTMVLTLAQRLGRETRIIDVIANNGKGLEWYVNELNKKPYIVREHFLPHDVRVRELGTGKSRLATLRDLGIKNITTNPHASIEDGINATRKMLYTTWIHANNCKKLIEALKTYRAEYDDVKQVYGSPIHDWASHYADSVRMLAIALEPTTHDPNRLPQVALGTGYDPLGGKEQSEYAQSSQRKSVYERWMSDAQSHASWNPTQHTIADPYYDDCSYIK